jgi:beta-galactosidase
LKKLTPISNSLVRAQVAIAFDWEAWWAVELDSKPAPIAYAKWAQEIHARFYAQNIAVDFVHPAEELVGYRLVIAPALYLLSEAAAANLAGFVAAGGHLLATYFSGIVDENEHVVLGGYPARLRALLGLWVEEWLPLGDGETDTIRYGQRGPSAPCTHWRDAIHPEGAEVLATFSTGIMAGRPAITQHRFGQGAAYYLGTKLGDAPLAGLLGRIGRKAGVAAVLQAPPGVEATLRERGDARFLFVLNHCTNAVRLPLRNYSGRNLITGKDVARILELPPLGAIVIELALKKNRQRTQARI